MLAKRSRQKSRSLPYVIDENEEIELSEGEKAQLKKQSYTPKFVIEGDEPIGSGTFNCAYFVNGKSEVLRIGYLPGKIETPPLNETKAKQEQRERGNFAKAERNANLIRGVSIVTALQEYKSILGPSLLLEKSTYDIIKDTDLRKYVRGEICPSILKTEQKYRGDSNHFVLQHLEYLGGGLFEYNEEQQMYSDEDFFVFSLIWFLSTANKVFGLRHHDLKSGNIILRKNVSPESYHFKYDFGNNEVMEFHFSNIVNVPVIIDYDAATVRSTKTKSAISSMGTAYSTPLDVLLFHIFSEFDDTQGYVHNVESYDWWSLGICILELSHPRFGDAFMIERNRYREYMIPALEQDPKSDSWIQMIDAVFLSCCIASIFSKTTETLRPPIDLYPRSKFLFRADLVPNDLIDMNWNRDYIALKDWAQTYEDDPIVMLLYDLLHWDPNRRTKQGRPEEHLKRFKDLTEKRIAYGKTYQYQASHSMTPIDLSHIKQLDAPICASCSISTNIYLCPCCHQTFCSTQCQAEKH